MKSLLTTIASVLFAFSSYGQAEQLESHYENAFIELKAMLEGNAPMSFKRAVFTVENVYMDGSLNYDEYNRKIEFLAQLGKHILNDGTLDYSEKDNKDVEKKFAVYRVLKHPIPLISRGDNDSIKTHATTPFTYDFEDFFGEKDWTKMFVTKLLETHSGNCHSLPFLYKILAEELGTEAHLVYNPLILTHRIRVILIHRIRMMLIRQFRVKLTHLF